MQILLATSLLTLSTLALAIESDTELYCEGTEKSTLIDVGVLASGNKTLNIEFNEKEQKLKLGFKPCLGELKREETKFTNNFISYECLSQEITKDISLDGIIFYSTSLNINRFTGELSFLHSNRAKNGTIQTYYSMKCNSTFKKF